MTLHLHNTLTRRLDPFVPLVPPAVSLYTCGPTVYNYAHIGNFRTFLFEDLLRRWLDATGYQVFHVMNLTDVDDKTIKGSLAQGATLHDHVRPYIDAFHADSAYLRLRPAHAYPRATEYIPAMIDLIEGLLAKGVAYRGDDGSVYFSIGRFPAYGQLSQLDKRQLKAGAGGRVSADEYDKENAQDFVLWKAAKPEDEQVRAAWDAPFGRGRPGWHLECSAMALDLVGKWLGQKMLDIHAGGVDLIFPHHEDEIAQSCAFTGEPLFARYWLHGEFLTLSGTKMSKRYGNILTARDLAEQGVDAGAVRFLIYSTHYRQRLDWTDEALDAAKVGSRGLGELRERLEAKAGAAGAAEFDALAARTWDAFAAAMNDDLSSPRALAEMAKFRAEANRLLDAGAVPGPAVLDTWHRMDGVLDVLPARTYRRLLTVAELDEPIDVAALATDAPGDPQVGERWAESWTRARRQAKKARNFASADEIRGRLDAAGFTVRDNKDGTVEIVRSAG